MDKQTIIKTLAQLHPNGNVFSIFIKGQSWQTGGYFTDHAKAVNEIIKQDGKAEAIYISLNPCNKSMLARANNVMKPKEGKPADRDILKYTHVYFDFDPIRPSNTCSTEAQHKEALDLAERVRQDLTAASWPVPIIHGDSGNGANLIFRVPDLPANEDTKNLIQRCLKALNEKYGTETLSIDTKVYDPSRITRVLGTMNKKGDEVPELSIRHRRSRIIFAADSPVPVSAEKLRELASQDRAQVRTTKQGDNSGRVNIRKYLDYYGVEIVREKRYGESTLYGIRQCVFDPSHTTNESSIVQGDNGALSYQFFHNSCQGKTWREAREVISGGDSFRPFMEGGNELSKSPNIGGGQLDNSIPEPSTLRKVQSLDSWK